MREGVERKIDREGEKGEKEVREGGGVCVLMLVLWDWGEGHKNPALTAFLKRGILSFHRAFCPSVFVILHLRLGCLRPGRGPYFGVCVVTVNNPQSSPNPHKALSRRTNHPLQLWFCHLWILCLFVLLLFTPILFLFPPPIPPHHPPIIFQALSWLSLPKPSGLIVWSWGIESAGWNEKWGSRSASLFILFSFPLSFIFPRSPFFFSHLSFTLHLPPSHTNPQSSMSALSLVFRHLLWPSPHLPISPRSSSPSCSFAPPKWRTVSYTVTGICEGEQEEGNIIGWSFTLQPVRHSGDLQNVLYQTSRFKWRNTECNKFVLMTNREHNYTES